MDSSDSIQVGKIYKVIDYNKGEIESDDYKLSDKDNNINNIKNIFDLGFPGNEGSLRKSIHKKNSITIMAAPTGEGKTTTLYSIIDYLNRPEINITTIEDPVEIRIDGLNQIEIGNKSTFSGALRTVLRQDPDIILLRRNKR